MKLTYEQIQSGAAFRKLPKKIEDKKALWDGCVALAVDLRENLKLNRMQIAEIAERSCFIYVGGDKKSEEFKKTFFGLSLKNFCKAAGLQYTTVNTWILVKNRVFNSLPKEHRGASFNLTVAREVGEYFRCKGYFGKDEKVPSPAEIKELYEGRIKPSERKMRMIRIMQYVRQSHFYLATKGNWSLFDEADQIAIKDYCVEMLASYNDYQAIARQKKTKKGGEE